MFHFSSARSFARAFARSQVCSSVRPFVYSSVRSFARLFVCSFVSSSVIGVSLIACFCLLLFVTFGDCLLCFFLLFVGADWLVVGSES